ncbi:anaerobic ribonucleoside-triphosphate reductase [Lachnospiraceae bacterium PF1-22]
MKEKISVLKKDHTKQPWDSEKIIVAIGKSAGRLAIKFSPEQEQAIIDIIESEVDKIVEESGTDTLPIATIHNLVENALTKVAPVVAKSYKDYRNYKKDFVAILDNVYQKSQASLYLGDKENANTDSMLVSTQNSLMNGYLNTALYEKFFLTVDEKQASKDGYIYIHDKSARQKTMNCCLFDVGQLLKGGFEMANLWYTEPKTIDTAFDVLGDIIQSAAAQQYGGFTVPELDKILAPYAEKSFNRLLALELEKEEILGREVTPEIRKKLEEFAWKGLETEVRQGYQGIEIKLNTVSSSRGDYPFTTITFGLGTNKYEKLISKTILKVHMKGQGKPGFEKPVLFPKLVFLYDEELHGPGKELEDIYELGIDCSAKTMYPDWLSLTGEGYVPEVYKKYKKAISPMGCRAFLSPWYERGGMKPADDKDEPVFVGRFNMGAVSLHLPMIYAKARRESKNFYEVLDYYLEMIRNFHKRTIDFIGEFKASSNPLAYCEGGFYGGHLKPEDKIKPLLKPMTISFGITALNELEQIHHKKSLVEDGSFSLEVMEYIQNKINQYKEEDDVLYAIYATPGESLCGRQVDQFRKEYGIVENVSSREYVSNSFHCHVTEDISPIQKQNLEDRFWNYFNGGKIQYCRYNIGYNRTAIKTLINRAMKMGFYEGVNLALSYCQNCGHSQADMGEACPKCGSKNITSIDRMNGYLSYSRTGTLNRDASVFEGRVVIGESKVTDYDSSDERTTRFNEKKQKEIKERVSM